MKKILYIISILCLLTFGSTGFALSTTIASSEGKTKTGVTFVEGTPNTPDSSGSNTRNPATPSQGSPTGKKSYLPQTGIFKESNLIVFGLSLLVFALGWLYWKYRNRDNSIRNKSIN